jgi:hypothetical protein
MGSVHPRNYNLIEKINKKSPSFVGFVIGSVSCWILREREGRKVKSTAALADGGLSEFFFLEKKMTDSESSPVADNVRFCHLNGGVLCFIF